MAWSGKLSATLIKMALVVVLFTATPSIRSEMIMITAGGPEHMDYAANSWQTDRSFLPGYKGVTKHTDFANNDDGLLQSCRVFHRRKPRPFQYQIPTSQSGLFEVTLYFAEIDSKRNASGKRRFDVDVQGQRINRNFDIYQAAGEALYNRTVLKTTVNATFFRNSTEVVIELLPRRFNPMICGIKLEQVFPWQLGTNVGNHFHSRHEACFVMASDGKAYLIGGRTRNIPVNIYDPDTRQWSTAAPPSTVKRLHHMQCVPDDHGKIWIVSAWTGNCCREKSVANVLVFDTKTLEWNETKTSLPEERRRGGGAAAVRIGSSIYVVGGNRGGHGAHSTAVAWFDRYDMDADEWEIHLPDAPHARDHTGGAVLVDPVTNHHLLCVAGGRNGGVRDFFNATIGPTDCFDFENQRWYIRESLGVQRAGAAYATSCDGTKMIIAGGEGFGRAWNNVDVFDGQTYSNLTALNVARHGTGLAMDCQRNKLYIASGSGAMGGSPELASFEEMDFS